MRGQHAVHRRRIRRRCVVRCGVLLHRRPMERWQIYGHPILLRSLDLANRLRTARTGQLRKVFRTSQSRCRLERLSVIHVEVTPEDSPIQNRQERKRHPRYSDVLCVLRQASCLVCSATLHKRCAIATFTSARTGSLAWGDIRAHRPAGDTGLSPRPRGNSTAPAGSCHCAESILPPGRNRRADG